MGLRVTIPLQGPHSHVPHFLYSHFFSVTGLRVTIPLQVRQMTTVRRKTSMMTTMMKALRDHQSLILGQV